MCEYTLMPTHMRARFSVEELRGFTLAEPFSSTKGCRKLKVPARGESWRDVHRFGTLLFDLQSDPGQKLPLGDPEREQHMVVHLMRLMQETDAPPEQFARLGLQGR